MIQSKRQLFPSFLFGDLIKEMLVDGMIFRFLFCAGSGKKKLLALRVSSARRELSDHS